MPCLRQKSEIVSPFARSRSASRSNRATSSAFLRLLMGPSRSYSTQRLPFRLDQFSGSRPQPYNSSNPFLLFAGEDLLSRDQSQSITLDGTTPFNIGSITKIFTS